MKTCPNCGRQIPDAANFCTHCGASVSEMISCPKCGKMVMKGTAFCMYCGTNLNGEVKEEKKKSGCGKVLGILFTLLLIGGAAAAGWYYFHQREIIRLEMEEHDRQQAIQDSIDNALYELEREEEEARIAAEQRIEDLKPLIATLYSFHGPYRDKALKFYSFDLKNAYHSWTTKEELEGPQSIFFEKKWDEGCGTWVLMKNFHHSITDATSPNENTATFEVDVTFALYSAYDDQPYLQTIHHKDILDFKYEGGEWKIDDFTRDGKSAKKAYRSGSSMFGREIC